MSSRRSRPFNVLTNLNTLSVIEFKYCLIPISSDGIISSVGNSKMNQLCKAPLQIGWIRVHRELCLVIDAVVPNDHILFASSRRYAN